MSDQGLQARRKELDVKLARWEERIRNIKFDLSLNNEPLGNYEVARRGKDILGEFEDHPYNDPTSSAIMDTYEGNYRKVMEQRIQREIEFARRQSAVDGAKYLVEQFRDTLKTLHQIDQTLLALDEDGERAKAKRGKQGQYESSRLVR